MDTSSENLRDLQRQIDEIDWYHEFDFGNGLRTTAQMPTAGSHRKIWRFIQSQLDRIDFVGKTVLDIGCWDGYWSFYAEKRGAAAVLATDDTTQNWANGRGLLLAKKLLKSSIEVDQTVSVYELERLNRRFDVVLCLGVYYHLVDPYASFAQIRHCCHRDTIVVLEGDATLGLRSNSMYYNPRKTGHPLFIPTPDGLTQMLMAAYLEAIRQEWMETPRKPSMRRRLAYLLETVSSTSGETPAKLNRMITVCRPFEGDNPTHLYKPPFGLGRYDSRFKPA